eukprot:1394960-Pyramimonas_sp.AAC.1
MSLAPASRCLHWRFVVGPRVVDPVTELGSLPTLSGPDFHATVSRDAGQLATAGLAALRHGVAHFLTESTSWVPRRGTQIAVYAQEGLGIAPEISRLLGSP